MPHRIGLLSFSSFAHTSNEREISPRYIKNKPKQDRKQKRKEWNCFVNAEIVNRRLSLVCWWVLASAQWDERHTISDCRYQKVNEHIVNGTRVCDGEIVWMSYKTEQRFIRRLKDENEIGECVENTNEHFVCWYGYRTNERMKERNTLFKWLNIILSDNTNSVEHYSSYRSDRFVYSLNWTQNLIQIFSNRLYNFCPFARVDENHLKFIQFYFYFSVESIEKVIRE